MQAPSHVYNQLLQIRGEGIALETSNTVLFLTQSTHFKTGEVRGCWLVYNERLRRKTKVVGENAELLTRGKWQTTLITEDGTSVVGMSATKNDSRKRARASLPERKI